MKSQNIPWTPKQERGIVGDVLRNDAATKPLIRKINDPGSEF